MDKISLEVLNECLSPEPSEFQNLLVNKLSEEYRDGKYYVGYEVYVLLAAHRMTAEILYDKGICVISTYGNEDDYFMEDIADSKDSMVSVDDDNLPVNVLKKWKQKIEDWMDEETAQDYLDSHEGQRSKVLTELCRKVASSSE